MPAQLKRRLTVFLVAVGLIALAFFLHWWFIGRHVESTDNAYVQGEITRVASQLGARVEEVLVRDNQHVDKGQLLVRLEDADFKLAVERAQAALATREGGTGPGAQQAGAAGQPDRRQRRRRQRQPGNPRSRTDRPEPRRSLAQARLRFRGTGHHPHRRQPCGSLATGQGPRRPRGTTRPARHPGRRDQAPGSADRQRPHRTGASRNQPVTHPDPFADQRPGRPAQRTQRPVRRSAPICCRWCRTKTSGSRPTSRRPRWAACATGRRRA